jgi:hypothetical protein
MTIFCSLRFDTPNLESQIPVFLSTRNRVTRLYPQALGFLFITSYDSQGYGGVIPPLLHTGDLRYIASGQPPQKTPLPLLLHVDILLQRYVWAKNERCTDHRNDRSSVVARVRFREIVFTEPLRSNEVFLLSGIID